ncbi:MAG: GGDEF domain-containing phosphodiesterase [Pseudomonadota bacterium]
MAEEQPLGGTLSADDLAGFDLSVFVLSGDGGDMRWLSPPPVEGDWERALAAAPVPLDRDRINRQRWIEMAADGDRARFLLTLPAPDAGLRWFEETLICEGAGRTRRFRGLIQPCQRAVAPVPSPDGGGRERQDRRRLARALESAPAGIERAFLMAGIDNLRDVQRALGPDAVDDLIVAVERTLTAALPPSAEMGRVAPSRFGIALQEMDGRALSALATALMQTVGAGTIETCEGPVATTISIGAAIAEAGAPLPEDIFAQALAAYDRGRVGRVEHFEAAPCRPTPATAAHVHGAAARLVMDALAEDRVTLAFQPVVGAASPHLPAFHECLVRIRDRSGTVLRAAEFMPAIEQLGLVRQIDRAVLRRALSVLAEVPDIRLSVNISAQSLMDAEWLAILEEAIQDHGPIAERLIVELTEGTAIADVSRARSFTEAVQRSGAALALDDFGAGHTSFGHFRDFRFDCVKIDGAFVRGLTRSPDNQALIKALIAMAQHFEMFTVAEFVETAEEAALLAELGVDCLQGYYFGAPEIAPAWLPDAGTEDLRYAAG